MIESIDDIREIVCVGRKCAECEVRKYKRLNNVAHCNEVPFKFYLDYARQLYFRRDKAILWMMKEYGKTQQYGKLIKIIRSGGVQYD